MSCLLYFCNSTFDELYSFFWFSYPRAVILEIDYWFFGYSTLFLSAVTENNLCCFS